MYPRKVDHVAGDATDEAHLRRRHVRRGRPVLRQRRRLPRASGSRPTRTSGRSAGTSTSWRTCARPGCSCRGGWTGRDWRAAVLRQHGVGGRAPRPARLARRTQRPSTRPSGSPSGSRRRTATAACRCAACARWASAPTCSRRATATRTRTCRLGARRRRRAGEMLSPLERRRRRARRGAEGRFLALPHPEVDDMQQMKAADRDRWLAGMQRLRRTLE